MSLKLISPLHLSLVVVVLHVEVEFEHGDLTLDIFQLNIGIVHDFRPFSDCLLQRFLLIKLSFIN